MWLAFVIVCGVDSDLEREVRMSVFIKMPSVCGAVSSSVDIFDAPLNPHGVICCDACKSIVQARESWAALYNYSFV